MIRKACMKEKETIMSLIKKAIVDMDTKGIFQWDDIYPDEEVIANDLKNEWLHVYEEDKTIKGIIVINEQEDEEYKKIEWEFTYGRQLVVHRLCICPQFQGQGIAKLLMGYAEQYGKDNGYEAIRLDTFTKNKMACALYERLGYKVSGMVAFRKGQFLCMEKGL